MKSVEERISALEARFANSWATQTRDEYESNFKTNCKQEILGMIYKATAAAVIFLMGAGYVLIKSETAQTFRDQNTQLSDELRSSIQKEITQEQADYNWERFHNYGITYRYLAEFYESTNVPAKTKRGLYLRAFDKAEQYYDDALEYNNKKAQTYYERAQLHSTLARRFGVTDRLEPKKAIDDFSLASQFYEPYDIKRGWRGDAYLEIGKLYVFKALEASGKDEVRSDLQSAAAFLTEATTDYENADPSVDMRKGLQKAVRLSGCIQNSVWSNDKDCRPDKIKLLMLKDE